MPGQVVDTETAAEFMSETLASVGAGDLAAIADDLQRKSELFRTHLDPYRLAQLGDPELRIILRSVFTARRKADAILSHIGADSLRESYLGNRFLNWMNHYVRGQSTATTGPQFEYFRDWVKYDTDPAYAGKAIAAAYAQSSSVSWAPTNTAAHANNPTPKLIVRGFIRVV